MNIIKKLFGGGKAVPQISETAVASGRIYDSGVDLLTLRREGSAESLLYENLRNSVPIVDAALQKIVRLTGGYKVVCGDGRMQEMLNEFIETVPVGAGGASLYAFTSAFLDSMLTYGSAAGEMLTDGEGALCGLALYSVDRFRCVCGGDPRDRRYYLMENGDWQAVQNPRLTLYSTLNATPQNPSGQSLLRGLPCLAAVLMRIYQSIGQNFDRVGNVRYAVTYKPSDSSEMAFAKERAQQIAKEWSDGMNALRCGEVRDFVAVGDVDIKVIGADNQTLDTNVPVRQLLEQIIAKLSIPPFLLGLNWSSTERMSSQQADILTSELEYYRRQLNPIIKRICETFIALNGGDCSVSIEWDNINLQDEAGLAQARLNNAQAALIERQLEE